MRPLLALPKPRRRLACRRSRPARRRCGGALAKLLQRQARRRLLRATCSLLLLLLLWRSRWRYYPRSTCLLLPLRLQPRVPRSTCRRLLLLLLLGRAGTCLRCACRRRLLLLLRRRRLLLLLVGSGSDRLQKARHEVQHAGRVSRKLQPQQGQHPERHPARPGQGKDGAGAR